MGLLKSTIITDIFNDTGAEIGFGTARFRQRYSSGEQFSVAFGPNSTYREYVIQSYATGFDYDNPRLVIGVSTDDLCSWSEVRISLQQHETSDGKNETFLHWTGIVPRVSSFQVASFQIFKEKSGRVSSRVHLALKSSTDLTKLLKEVRICRNQCHHLVQTYKKGIEKAQHLHSKLAEDPVQQWRYVKDGRSDYLLSFLDSLELVVCDAKNLLRACAKEVDKIALLVSSMPMPPNDQKEMEICSNFDLVIGELNWSFDLIEYALQPGQAVKLEWCSTLRRYALNREGSTGEEVKNTDFTTPSDTDKDGDSPARVDREELLSGLESGSISVRNDATNSWWKQALYQLKTQFNCQATATKVNDEHHPKPLHDIIVERCKVEMHFETEQKPDENLRSLSVDPDCFRIHHLDLKLYTERLLGSGGFKNTYEGEWCGQSVAIATIRDFNFELLKDEVKQLIGLQHPKVVTFYGWACTEDAPPPIKTPEEAKDNLKCQGFYIVTEKMECDLHYLIRKIILSTTVKRDSGGPFSHSVGLDILLQIVEAMLHVHKYNVIHRDLKPGNFLVRSRSSPKSNADKFYDVKLIDFGSSKIFVDDKNTYDRGTTRYSPPETMRGKGGEGEHGKYDQSVDVFSFAMTCYQVLTGVEPFRNKLPREEILAGKRPDIPATILPGFKELMEASWAEDPKTRPTFEKIQESLWTIKKSLAVPIEWY